ncbi:MAG TPA: SlyX family protein [Chthoniobacterales bacterium]|jgi:uncharacterized coiled-coil protein SlyX
MSDTQLPGRVTDLEVKFSFLEEHVVQQDREIMKLRTQVEKQAAEIERLRADTEGEGISIRGDERPPHY